ncbi:MAG: RecQ family ATP-dependent DNA helicase [Flavobacteriales bacterium]
MILQQAKQILKQYWGYPEFRGLQGDIISSVLSGKHTIGLLPTGGGKSICYQVPGLALDGITIVISPLLALMQDQLHGLTKRNIKAYQFTGSYSPRQLDEAFRNIKYGGYKFVFLAPERLSNTLFLEYLQNAEVSLIAIDEAHCISQWGFDFRPSYLNVHLLRERFPNIPVLALTASATDRVKKDLAEQLQIPDATMYEGSVRRDNLQLEKRLTPNKDKQLLRLLGRLTGTGIIYAKTRSSCESISHYISENGLHSTFFHAGLDLKEKNERQERWLDNKVPIMVSTTAFGMGIDKADVMWVIHWDAPDTIEGYYQEVGRGGRGGQLSQAYLLYNQQDFARISKGITDLPKPEEVEAIYHKICSHFQIAVGGGQDHQENFSLVDLATKLQTPIPQLLTYIKLLQQRGVWQFIESDQLYPELLFLTSPEHWSGLPENDQQCLIQLFRVYSRAAQHSTRIQLDAIAPMLHKTVKDLDQWLQRMHQKGLIQYKAEQNQCALLFLENRIDKRYFKLSKSFVESWITSKKERSQAILDFLASEECLAKDVERYFGQTPGETCGICSNCTLNHYPDGETVQAMLKDGLSFDDIWFDLNCPPDALRQH